MTSELRVCADGATLRGLDVSYYQGNIDWTKVKAAGMSFAFARVSDGIATPDTKFSTYFPAIAAAGMVRGVYQFFRPTKDPVLQADLLINRVNMAGGLLDSDLPPVIDFEVLDGATDVMAVAAAKAWIDRIEQKLHRRPIIYTGNNLASTTMSHFSKYPLWLPNYVAPPTCPLVPSGWMRWDFWQDSDTATVSGIAGMIDTNYFNGDMNALLALVAASHLDQPDMSKGPDSDIAVLSDMAAATTDMASPCH